ncbi:MAG: ATP-binding cassette domain-containing protein, partial [Melioribacteraceae bacterium]
MENNISPVILTAMELEVHYGEQIVLNKALLSIHEGDRIGLVGRNGAGKSTFLKIISDVLQPDSGNVAKRKDLEIGFLTQEFTLDQNKNVFQNVLAGAESVLKIIKEYEELSYDSPRRIILEEKIHSLDGWNLDNKIKRLLQSLNAPDGNRDIQNLSGGEKRRVALCRS